MCAFLEYKDMKVVYKRYASLYFCCAVEEGDNELACLEVIHRYVELLDRYFGSVCELDIIFNFEKAYFILDEFLIAGEVQVHLRVILQWTSLAKLSGDLEEAGAEGDKRAGRTTGRGDHTRLLRRQRSRLNIPHSVTHGTAAATPNISRLNLSTLFALANACDVSDGHCAGTSCHNNPCPVAETIQIKTLLICGYQRIKEDQ